MRKCARHKNRGYGPCPECPAPQVGRPASEETIAKRRSREFVGEGILHIISDPSWEEHAAERASSDRAAVARNRADAAEWMV